MNRLITLTISKVKAFILTFLLVTSYQSSLEKSWQLSSDLGFNVQGISITERHNLLNRVKKNTQSNCPKMSM